MLSATAVLAALALAAPAPTGARPADGQLWDEVRVARSYWSRPDRAEAIRQIQTARAIPPCESIDASFSAYPDGSRNIGGWVPFDGSCAVHITPRFAARSRSSSAEYLSPYGAMYVALREESAVVIHEVGHAIGLTHDDAATFPIMGETLGDEMIPGRSRAWARNIVRARRAR